MTDYKVTTASIVNKYMYETMVESSVEIEYQELVNAENSYTLINQVFNMNLQNDLVWSTDKNANANMLVCAPYD